MSLRVRYPSDGSDSFVPPIDTNITDAATEEGTEIAEKGTEENEEIGRPTRLRRNPVRMEDYIL